MLLWLCFLYNAVDYFCDFCGSLDRFWNELVSDTTEIYSMFWWVLMGQFMTKMHYIFTRWSHVNSNSRIYLGCANHLRHHNRDGSVWIPYQSVVHCWDQKAHSGHLVSARGQIAQKCPIAIKFNRKDSWLKCRVLMGQRSCRGQMGSTIGQIA